MQANILVVEDNAKTASTMQLYLEREGHKVSVVHDGLRAIEVARAKHPDLIILDVMLPQLNGLDVCRTLRRESDVYIILVTARTTEQDKLQGLDLGADDYITKPFSPRELMARVRAVLRRQRPQPEEELIVIETNGLSIDLARHEITLNESPVYLTPSEFKLVRTLAQSPERVFTRQELVERTFGYDYAGLERTIDAHIMNLRKKIEPDRLNPSFIVTVFGVGYKFSRGSNVS